MARRDLCFEYWSSRTGIGAGSSRVMQALSTVPRDRRWRFRHAYPDLVQEVRGVDPTATERINAALYAP